MYTLSYFNRTWERIIDPLLGPLDKLCIKPIVLSYIALLFALVSASLFYFEYYNYAFVLLAMSLIFDGIDGPLARKKQMDCLRGEMADVVSDRTGEFAVFAALVANGSVQWQLGLGAYIVIILCTLLRNKAEVDFGFKRVGVMLGLFVSFNTAFWIILGVNALCFLVQLIVIDYRRKH